MRRCALVYLAAILASAGFTVPSFAPAAVSDHMSQDRIEREIARAERERDRLISTYMVMFLHLDGSDEALEGAGELNKANPDTSELRSLTAVYGPVAACKAYDLEKYEDCVRMCAYIEGLGRAEPAVQYLGAEALEKLGRTEAAERWRKRIDEADYDEARYRKAGDFFYKHDLHDLAEKPFKKVVELKPDESVHDTRAIFILGDIAIFREEFFEAGEFFFEAYNIDDRNGYDFRFQGKQSEVEKDTRNMARAYELRKMHRKEADILLKSISMMQEEPTASYLARVGEACYHLGSYEDAESYYNQAIEKDAGHSSCYTGYYDVLMKLERFEEASKTHEKAVEIFTGIIEKSGSESRIANACNGLAWFYATHNEKLDEAEELSRKSLELSPDECTYLDTLSEILYRRGKREKAIKLMEEIIEKRPINILYYQQQLAKFKNGKDPDAWYELD